MDVFMGSQHPRAWSMDVFRGFLGSINQEKQGHLLHKPKNWHQQ